MKVKSVSLGLTIIGLLACGLWQARLSEFARPAWLSQAI